jgi:ADP-heptose:LPS heptosyltransferase/glycosyltransferase involved in cell wall biosynthesis/2-polyprenyl-3-methyl-5-hydroxy-6-metoxy-1,4-benzoquinol methylase
MNTQPFVSCIMPTADRRRFVPGAIRCFLAQDYAEKELVIVDDGADSVADLVPDDPRVRYLRAQTRRPVGAKRNFACREARGDVLVHWDDDDWSAPWRLRYQIDQLRETNADICGLSRIWFYALHEKRAWEYIYPPRQKPWVYGASLCYTREFWQKHPFPEIRLGEDTRFVWADARARVHALPDSRFLVALIHDKNTSRKRTADSRYQPRDVAEIERLLGQDATAFFSPGAIQAKPARPKALISAALGIGDILRVTPVIRAAHALGYEVDALLATDYPEAARLLEGAPEIHRVFQVPSARCRDGITMVDGLGDSEYDVAAFTTWSAPLRKRVRSRRALAFDRAQWLKEGDSRSVERIARELGWQGEMPEPFAMASTRRFELPPGTVALHPGCKVEWPWKKWHGFDELARKFPSVVIVGSDEDLRTDGTYFRRDFVWPEHAQNFVGKLSLPDTAALLRACAALISNDSGLMQLAVALGVPTFGIFGITSPAREAMPSKYFRAITKALPCEAACHAGTWGRRDCHRHLECLKTLTPDEVFMKVSELLPEMGRDSTSAAILPPAALRTSIPPAATSQDQQNCETINLVYYGYVFDASGYGQAARAYIHALYEAGVNLSVVDLANHGRQVPDKLVESLAGRTLEPDFHLFHGIPPLWARRAFPLRNVVAMTVWETDAMPPQWRPALNHALEVWLPCQFNVSVFEAALGKPIFKLPHAWAPNNASPAPDLVAACGIREDDFVFFSIFEWQERKGPNETIEAFLRAFPEPSPVVLALKTNPGAAQVAASTLAELRGRIPSQARIELRAEAWSEEQMAAFQQRGDCYVSLHRGEGWNYPLFEAAGRGKAIVATGFSGPTEYLDPTVHRLVRHRPASVRQRYAFYSATMHWAEPEIDHAVELFRTAFAEREQCPALTGTAARIQRDFSSQGIGAAARQRLLQLLRKTNPAKWDRFNRRERHSIMAPAIPIPGDWYDADYFEYGRKSNWEQGYSWPLFRGVFAETAEYLIKMFPEAERFLDAGCAKGFLVRALREKNREAWGFDHSPWATAHAEDAAKPFLSLASVDNATFEQPFDVVVAMSLFESLTEQQIRSFLPRARTWTRQAIFATIATVPAGWKATASGENQDSSHILLRDRSWWRERFLEAGWRQDAVHKIAERTCQADALPAKMDWTVYVFSPGQ